MVDIMSASFSSASTAFEISLGLTGVLALWMGLMKIGERGGVITFFGRLISPLFSRLFPGVPKGHPAMGSIFMNVSANMLGLDNAATPMGLKAMQEPAIDQSRQVARFRCHDHVPGAQCLGSVSHPHFNHDVSSAGRSLPILPMCSCRYFLPRSSPLWLA